MFRGGFELDFEIASFPIFDLNHIKIPDPHRGKGLGLHLYQIVESIAADLGCSLIRMTASGHTQTGEPRRQYLQRKLGYALDGAVATKEMKRG